MSTSDAEHDPMLVEAAKLIDGLFNEELVGSDFARLDQLLRESAKVREYYLLQTHLLSALRAYVAKAESAEPTLAETYSPSTDMSEMMILPAVRPEDVEADVEPITAPPMPGNPPQDTGKKSARRLFRFGAAAAILLGVLTGAICLWYSTHSSTPIAMLFDARNAVWTAPRIRRAFLPVAGRPLPDGPLGLERGAAEIRLANGVSTVVEGPARFEILSTGLVRLDVGKLAAVVPAKAHGFTVRTPCGNVVDLGTEFGVQVGADQQSHVEVFKGTVRAEAIDSSGQTKLNCQVNAGEAVEIASAGTITPSQPLPSAFIRPGALDGGELPSAATLPTIVPPVAPASVSSQVKPSAVAAAAPFVQVDLSKVFNNVGIYAEGPSQGVTDRHGRGAFGYSATALGSRVTFDGTSFTLGPPDKKNALEPTDKRVPVPAGRYQKLCLIGAAFNANGLSEVSVQVIAGYSDGSTQSLTLPLSDWSKPRHYANEQIVSNMPYRISKDGAKDPARAGWYLYGYALPLDQTKTLNYVHLKNGHLARIFAMGLEPAR